VAACMNCASSRQATRCSALLKAGWPETAA